MSLWLFFSELRDIHTFTLFVALMRVPYSFVGSIICAITVWYTAFPIAGCVPR